MRLTELFVEAGGPVGLLQCINGDKEIVDAICDHDTIKAVSFVGSSDIAQYVYARATANGKRAQCMGGAKNHGIIMPDANMEQAAKDILGAAYGSAGERCMALPVVVPVGEGTAERFLDALLPKIDAMTVGTSTDPDADYGPVVTDVHKRSIEADIDKAVAEGATVIRDGRGFTLQGHEGGFFVGPTLLDDVTPDMDTYHEEIFGPVLQIVRAKDFEAAVRLPSDHQYGNGVAIFTQNGRVAREFADRVEVGMVGINVPIPVPVAYHSFGGWKRSAFGDANQYGMEGLRFYTKVKTVTQRWPEGETEDSAFIIPTF
jgi:malonate-semialdehyde dehydrogenase (acetylating)/methylmalonate-semialdehyde dehydrogenase